MMSSLSRGVCRLQAVSELQFESTREGRAAKPRGTRAEGRAKKKIKIDNYRFVQSDGDVLRKS